MLICLDAVSFQHEYNALPHVWQNLALVIFSRSRYQKDFARRRKIVGKIIYWRNSEFLVSVSVYAHKYWNPCMVMLQGKIACVVHVNPHDQTIVHQDCYPKVKNDWTHFTLSKFIATFSESDLLIFYTSELLMASSYLRVWIDYFKPGWVCCWLL
jgi:hypothetical protein